MSKLLELRSRLAALRRRVWLLRVGTVSGAAATAWLALLLAIYLIDWTWEPGRGVRIALLLTFLLGTLAAVAAVLGAAFRRLPTIADLALQLERQQGIDSDLVAALEFDAPAAQSTTPTSTTPSNTAPRNLGSPQLQSAVVAYVADFSRSLYVFAGLSYRGLIAAAAGAALLGLLLIGLAAGFPQHAAAFFDRLLLGSAHYPTQTQIVAAAINGQPILGEGSGARGLQPIVIRAPYGRPLNFEVLAAGRLPENGTIQLRGASGQRALLSLVRGDAQSDDPAEVKSPEVAAPHVAAVAAVAAEQPAADAVQPAATSSAAPKYAAALPALTETVSYEIRLGDAWTDRQVVTAIPLPTVDVSLNITPPAYTQGGADALDPQDAGARLAAVVEGSAVVMNLLASKPLQKAAATIDDRTFAFFPLDDAGRRWRLEPGSPLDRIEAALSFSVTAVDVDGLPLPEPARGFIRLKADRPPKVYADVTTRHVMPTARPNIWFGAADDYGLAELRLHVQRLRNGDEGEPYEVEVPLRGRPRRVAPLLARLPAAMRDDLDRAALTPALRQSLEEAGWPLSKSATVAVQQAGGRWAIQDAASPHSLLVRQERGELYVYRQFFLDLSQFDLQPDDQLRIELEAVDYRGEQPGRSTLSEPLVLNVTDERGVLAAMVETDQRSAQQLNTIIQRQLGIGEAR